MKTQLSLFCAFFCFAQIVEAQTWHALGPGLNGPVHTIVPHGSDIYVGGAFTDAGDHPDADYLARWDGCDWHAVAPGLNSAVTEIALVEDRIYVAGNFTDVADNPDIDGIAFWDGAQWNALGSGLDYYVSDMEVIGSDLYVGGGFNAAGEDAICVIARWDGSSWHKLGVGLDWCAYDFTYVSDIATDGVNLYVVGLFQNMGGIESADRIARWDGTMWHGLGEGIPFIALWNDNLSLTIDGNHVYVAGAFRNAGGNEEADYLVVWDGSEWAGLSQSPSDSTARNPFILQGDLHCVFGNEIRRWDEKAEEWIVVVSIDVLFTLTPDEQNLYVGGFLDEINGQQFSGIARWGEEIQCTSAIKGERNGNQEVLEVYPNPADVIIQYAFDHDLLQLHMVTLTDATGKVVLHKQSRESKLNIEYLTAGMYFLHVHSPEKGGIAKFIKY